jgi:hypothetical protein
MDENKGTRIRGIDEASDNKNSWVDGGWDNIWLAQSFQLQS